MSCQQVRQAELAWVNGRRSLFLLIAFGLLQLAAAAQTMTTLVPTTYTVLASGGGSTVPSPGNAANTAATLDINDQSGAQWTTSKIVQFNAGSSYSGYESYTLPASIPVSSITAIKLKVNYSGACPANQVWTWSLWNWVTNAYVAVGNNNGVACWGNWAMLTFNVPGTLANYVRSSDRYMQVGLTANNGTDGMAEDYEALAITSANGVSVSVSPTTATLIGGGTQQFTATVTGSSNTSVTWSLTGVGTLSASGLYTAPATVPNTTTATVKATSVADTTKSATATVTINPVSVSVSPTAASLGQGGTQQFTATVTNGGGTGVTWSVTGLGTVSGTGLYTAPATITATSTATVSATSTKDPTKSASATVTLNPPAAISVAISPTSALLGGGQTQQFTATVTGTANTAVTWSWTGLGTLSASGLYTAPASVTSVSTASVKATSAADTTKSATATVTLNPVSVAVSPATASVATAATQQFNATVSYASNTSVTWQVNNVTGGNSTVGTISTSGLYTAPAAVPNPATVTVKAVSVADSTKSATASVTVTTVLSAAPGVGVSGNRIIATTAGKLGLKQVSAGATLDLRGVNLSGSEYACLDGTGFWDNPTGNQTTINHMRDDWHANSIRLPLNEECWLGINGAPPATSGTNYQNTMGTFVNLATASGMVVEVDLHFGAGGSALPVDDNYPGMDADHAPAFWQSVANYFKGNPSVIFNLTNEPQSITWSCYLNGGCTAAGGTGSWTVVGTQSVVSTIRGTGATNAIIIAGLNWSNDLSQWLSFVPADSSHAIVAGAHVYQDGLGCDTASCWTSQYQAIENAGYPVIISEFGQFTCNHSQIDLLMSWADAANPPVGYWAWAFTVAGCAAGPSLITDANGTPTQTYGQGYHDHLRAVQ